MGSPAAPIGNVVFCGKASRVDWFVNAVLGIIGTFDVVLSPNALEDGAVKISAAGSGFSAGMIWQ